MAKVFIGCGAGFAGDRFDAAVPVVRGVRVVVVGCGVAAASLCVAFREPACRISAVGANRDLVRPILG